MNLKACGVRLAAVASGLIINTGLVSAENFNFTNIAYNTSAEPVLITYIHTELLMTLLTIIAICQVLQLFFRLAFWIMTERKD